MLLPSTQEVLVFVPNGVRPVAMLWHDVLTEYRKHHDWLTECEASLSACGKWNREGDTGPAEVGPTEIVRMELSQQWFE